MLKPLFTLSAQRAIKSELPSCIKSFILPYSFVLSKYLRGEMSDELAMQLLSFVYSGLPEADSQEGKFLITGQFIAKWIDTAPQFTGSAGELSYLGLTALLKITMLDQQLASLLLTKPRPSWMSEESAAARPKTMLQTTLVATLATYLCKLNQP